MCQCPKSGEVHFYINIDRWTHNTKRKCQCPKSGEVHFYPKGNITVEESNACVNALSRAKFISTFAFWPYLNWGQKSVNALSRAKFISTGHRKFPDARN